MVHDKLTELVQLAKQVLVHLSVIKMSPPFLFCHVCVKIAVGDHIHCKA
jgi:hypothetical protein